MLILGWKIAGEDAAKVNRAPFSKLPLKKEKVRSFSAIKRSLEPICPWEPGTFAADRRRWAEGW